MATRVEKKNNIQDSITERIKILRYKSIYEDKLGKAERTTE